MTSAKNRRQKFVDDTTAIWDLQHFLKIVTRKNDQPGATVYSANALLKRKKEHFYGRPL